MSGRESEKVLADLRAIGTPDSLCWEAADKIEWLLDLLKGRDNFIVSKDLWFEFMATLK